MDKLQHGYTTFKLHKIPYTTTGNPGLVSSSNRPDGSQKLHLTTNNILINYATVFSIFTQSAIKSS